MVDDELRYEEKKLLERATQIQELHEVRPAVRLSADDPAARILEVAKEGETPEKTLMAGGSRGLGTMRRIRLGAAFFHARWVIPQAAPESPATPPLTSS